MSKGWQKKIHPQLLSRVMKLEEELEKATSEENQALALQLEKEKRKKEKMKKFATGAAILLAINLVS